jgi:hypothetical protein
MGGRLRRVSEAATRSVQSVPVVPDVRMCMEARCRAPATCVAQRRCARAAAGCAVCSVVSCTACALWRSGTSGSTRCQLRPGGPARHRSGAAQVQWRARRRRCEVHVFYPTLPEEVRKRMENIHGVTLHEFGLGVRDGQARRGGLWSV